MNEHPLSSLDADIRDHIARETQENIERGLSPTEARLAALRKFGSITLAIEDTRAVWVPGWFDRFRQDVRYAIRMLRRHPGFTCVAVTTLALGVGLTTAVFSVVHAVLLKPLPYANAERIVTIWETNGGRGSASAGHFHDWSEQATVFEATAASRPATFNLADPGEPERLSGMRVTAGYFDVASMPPAIGRYFRHDEALAGDRVVVLGHGLWVRRFGADPAIVGRQIRLSGEPFTVVGVAPAAFALTDPTRSGVVGGFSAQLWTPLTFTPQQRANYGSHSFVVLAKLKPGISQAAAQQDVERVTHGIAERNPRAMEGRWVAIETLNEALTGDVSFQLFVLMTGVVFVLAIGCVNIASLLLARAASRQREIAIRVSLGGGHLRIVRQLLTESLVLAAAGAVPGIVVAYVTVGFFVSSGPASLPRLRDAGLQPAVLLFALALTVGAAFLFGLAPAIRAASQEVQSFLRGNAGSLSAPPRDRLRGVMVAAQIAVAAVLLVGTGLLVRTAQNVRQVPLGFDAHGTLTARLALPPARFGEPLLVVDAYRRMLGLLRGVEGIAHAGASTNVPLLGGSVDATFNAEGMTLPPDRLPSPHVRLVTDGYLEAIGMHLRRGRTFEPSDMLHGSPSTVVINQRLADVLWPSEDPLGKRISGWTANAAPEWREVIGVVGNVRTFGQRAPIEPEVFLPYTQAPDGAWDTFQRSMVLVIRPREDWPVTYAPEMRRAVAAVDPTIPLYDMRTMEGVFVEGTAARRFSMRLVLILAATGLTLTTVGLYGVISYFVAQRTFEIGLRLALGADRVQVIRLVVARGLRLAGTGIALGLIVALVLTRMIAGLLYEVGSTDPATYAVVAALLFATTAIASAIPAVQAARVDPLVALRRE